MSVVETVLIFVGIPLAVIGLVVLAVYGKSVIRQPNRYRPGKSWDYPPTWYVPHPEVAGAAGRSGSTTAVGGASGEW